MTGQRAALSLGQRCFFQLGHATVTAGVKREVWWHAIDLFSQLLHDLLETGIAVRLERDTAAHDPGLFGT